MSFQSLAKSVNNALFRQFCLPFFCRKTCEKYDMIIFHKTNTSPSHPLPLPSWLNNFSESKVDILDLKIVGYEKFSV